MRTTAMATQNPSLIRRGDKAQRGGPGAGSTDAERVAATAYPRSGTNAMGTSATIKTPASHRERHSPRKGQANEAATRFTRQPYRRVTYGQESGDWLPACRVLGVFRWNDIARRAAPDVLVVDLDDLLAGRLVAGLRLGRRFGFD